MMPPPAGSTSCARLEHLRLRNFRLFESIDFAPASGANFLIGPNASGKTSMLEAICLLLRLQSPRAATPARCIRFGAGAFGIEGHVGGHHLQFRYDAGGRKLLLDQVPQARTADYLAVGRITWFSNDDLRLINGASGGRRRYLDFLGSQLIPGYLPTLRSYERALRARNFLLKEGRSREVEAYTGLLVPAGTALQTHRESLMPGIQSGLGAAGDVISGGNEKFGAAYLRGQEGDLAEAIRGNRAEESRLRTTLAGPHRDDLALTVDGRSAADFASEGQQRTLALALKVAQAGELERATGRAPLLLLDDIFGELDAERRNRFLHSLPEQAQKFVTTTFLHWKTPDPEDAIFQLADGKWHA